MKLIFIGEDGSMGLERGKKYNCQINVHPGSNWVWIKAIADGRVYRCPYSSLKKLLENWLEI